MIQSAADRPSVGVARARGRRRAGRLRRGSSPTTPSCRSPDDSCRAGAARRRSRPGPVEPSSPAPSRRRSSDPPSEPLDDADFAGARPPRSFFAQPDPLKWIAGAVIALRIGPLPQSGQVVGPVGVDAVDDLEPPPARGAVVVVGGHRIARAASAAEQAHAALRAVERPLVGRREPAVGADEAAAAGGRDGPLDRGSGRGRTGWPGCC